MNKKEQISELGRSKAIDMTGSTHNDLFVIRRSHSNNEGVYWECLCVCGEKTITGGKRIRSGHVKSCGCRRVKSATRHGLSRHPLYFVWHGMVQRCINKEHDNYPRYGGRGITVCDEWVNNPKTFFDDMGDRPDGLTIDRINNNKGYSSDNCRWASAKTQSNNKRNNTWLCFAGQAFTLKELCENENFNYNSVNRRISRGRSVMEATGLDVKPITYEQAMVLKGEETCLAN